MMMMARLSNHDHSASSYRLTLIITLISIIIIHSLNSMGWTGLDYSWALCVIGLRMQT